MFKFYSLDIKDRAALSDMRKYFLNRGAQPAEVVDGWCGRG